MKQILLLTFIFLHLLSYPQQKDRRKYIGKEIIFSSFKVSSSGEIWMANHKNELFFSESIDSSWKEIKFSEENKFRPSFTDEENELILFDENGIIIPAKIRDTNFYFIDGLAISQNKGTTWEFVVFPEKIFLHNISIDKNRILQGFTTNKSKLEIYNSADLGKTWTKQKTSSKLKGYLAKEMHTSSGQGILIFKYDKIYVTNSNWEKSKKINNEKIEAYYNILTRYFDSYLVKNIEVFKDSYIMHYENRIYCTKTEKIQWKPINYEILCYDSDSSKIVAVTTDGELLTFENFESIKPSQIVQLNNLRPIEKIKLVGNAIYLIQDDSKVVKFLDGKKNYLNPYSCYEAIPNPYLQIKTGNSIWSVEDNHIYISEDNGLSWYREAILEDFNILEFNLLNDSTIVLWTDHSNYLEYSLRTHQFSHSEFKYRLDSFLIHPIKKLNLSFYNRHSVSKLDCNYKDSITLNCQCLLIKEKDTVSTSQEIHLESIYFQLKKINNNVPIVSEFPFTLKDIKKYYEIEQEKNNPKYYAKQMNIFPVLKYDYKANSLFLGLVWYQFFENKFEFSISNSKGDTLDLLSFSNQGYALTSDSTGSWLRTEVLTTDSNLYQNNLFSNGQFMNLILSYFPEEHRNKMGFTNIDLLKAWAYYYKSRM